MKKLIVIVMVLLNILTLGSSDLHNNTIETNNYVQKLLEEDDMNIVKKFISPVEYTRISSKYNFRRLHPIFATYKPHMGIDLAAPLKSPVKAVYDGKIEYIGWTKGGGNTIIIKHNNVYTTVYYHLHSTYDLKIGDNVLTNQIIGEVGSTGWSTGPHLDFRIYMYDTPINPVKVMNFINSEVHV